MKTQGTFMSELPKERLGAYEKSFCHTFICEVKSILNSRPITPSRNDINDYEALTPNHLGIYHEIMHEVYFEPTK